MEFSTASEHKQATILFCYLSFIEQSIFLKSWFFFFNFKEPLVFQLALANCREFNEFLCICGVFYIYLYIFKDLIYLFTHLFEKESERDSVHGGKGRGGGRGTSRL